MNVVVVSAHPDDEVIGAGGSLLRHVAQGDSVYWLIITNIFAGEAYSAERVEQRQQEIEQVAAEIGFAGVFKLDYQTATLSSQSLIQLVPQISAVFHKCQPEVVYCVNRSDAHSDHRVVFEGVMACTKSFRYPFIKTVLLYECLSETEFAPALAENQFLPNYFVDITDYMERKIALLKYYASEMGEHPFPRSVANVRALAHFRGATAGVQQAEAFQLLKHIIK
jgi:N-acetylglucosamine malate deacetylase 1